MSKRGILWRVLGADPELWQSAEAWAVVADLCEQEGHEARARGIRQALSTETSVRIGRWRHLWCSAALPPTVLSDSDGVLVYPCWDEYFDEHGQEFWVLVIAWPGEIEAVASDEACCMRVAAL